MLPRPNALTTVVCVSGGAGRGGQYGPAARYFMWVHYGQQCRSCATRDHRVKLLARFIILFYYRVVTYLF